MAVTGKLEADFSSFYEACAQASKALGDLAKSGQDTAKDLNTAEQSTTSFIGSLAGLAGGVAGGELLADAFYKVLDVAKELAGAIPELIGQAIDLGDKLYEASLKTGASVENLSALRYVAGQTGVDFNTFVTSMEKMEVSLGKTGSAANKTRDNLAALGLNLTTIKNEKPDEAFIDIMNALEALPSRADQARIGAELFGRGFKEMSGLTQESMTELMAKAQDMGVVMSTQTAAAAHAAEVGFQNLKSQLEAVATHIGSAFLPAIVGLTGDLGTLFKGALDAVNSSLNAMGGSGGFLGTVAAAMGTGAKATEAQTKLYDYLREGLVAVVRWGVEPMITGFSLLMQAWDEVEIAGKGIALVFEGVTYAIEDVLYYTTKLAQYTDPLNAAQYKADAATISTAMADLKTKMQGQAADITTLAKNEVDWGKAAQTTNAAIEKSLTDLEAKHTDVNKVVEDYKTKSEKAFGGPSTVIDAQKEKLTGLDKTLADLTAKIDAANNANTSYAEKLKLWGPAAAKAAEEAHAVGKAVADSVQDVADAYQQEQFDKLSTKMTDGIKLFSEQLKDIPKVASDSFKPLLDEYKELGDWQEKIYQQTTTGTDLVIHNIDREREAKLKALDAEGRAHDATYTQLQADINTYYNHEIDLANHSADTIEARMAKQGVFTQDMLAQQAFDAAEAYNQMVADGHYGAAELEKAAKKARDAWKLAADDTSLSWSQTFTRVSSAFGEIGNAASALGTAVGGSFGKMAATAGKALGDISGGFSDIAKGLASGNIIGEIAGITSGIVKLSAAAVTAVKNLFGLGSAGRDAVVAFAATEGGFDALHTKLDALGDSGEQLWIKLTQGVGKNDPAAAQAAITAVTDALNKQSSAQQDTTQVTEAQALATVETATQASAALDTVTQKLKDNAGDWQTWGDAVNGVINAVGKAVLAMPTPSAPGAVPGFATGTGGKYLDFGTGTLAMLHGKEKVVTAGEDEGGGGGTAVIQLDGRTIAEIAVPHIPGVVKRYGLTA